MNRQAQSSIMEMLNSFGQTGQNYEVLLLTLDRLCAGLSDQAIIEAAKRFASGDVKDQSKRFAPSGPEFIEEARRRQEFLDLLARPRLQAPTYQPGPLAPFQMAKQKAFAANSHREVLMEDVSLDVFRRLSGAGQIPAGAKWVACLGALYGPEPKKSIDHRTSENVS